jgi:DNA-binding transcriptional ArsR family regulator
MPSTTGGRPAAVRRQVESSVVRADGAAGVTVVLGASPVTELFFALCAHARLVELDEAQLPWHHAFAKSLDQRGGALFERFFGGFDRGLLLSDLFVCGPHRDLERFPGWIESLNDAQFLWLVTGREPRRSAIEGVLAGRLAVRDLHLPPSYRDDVGSVFEDPADAREQFVELIGYALAAGWGEEAETLRPFWREALLRQQADLEQIGLVELLRRFGDAPQILRQLCERRSSVRLELVPSCYIGARWANVYGPGHMVCAFQVRPPGWSVDDTLTLELVRRRAEALAEPSRLSLLRMVALGEATGGRALAARSGLTPATVSRHMAQLARAGLIRSQVQGREVRYELDAAAIRAFGPHLMQILGQSPRPDPFGGEPEAAPPRPPPSGP